MQEVLHLFSYLFKSNQFGSRRLLSRCFDELSCRRSRSKVNLNFYTQTSESECLLRFSIMSTSFECFNLEFEIPLESLCFKLRSPLCRSKYLDYNFSELKFAFLFEDIRTPSYSKPTISFHRR